MKNKASVRRDLMAWLIMAPTIILFAFFVWVPLIESIVLSFFNAHGMRINKFVGLQNYISAFKLPDFMPALQNTFVYILWSLVIGFFVPILLAIMISETIHLKGFFRIGVYFPNIVPGIATAYIWLNLYKAGPTGVLNILLSKIIPNFEPVAWLQGKTWIIPLIVIAMTWKGAGSTALIYMAGISSINAELYEAATIDGAGIFQRIIHITLPQIFSLGKTMLILQIISVFQILYEPLIITNGGPNNASISILMLVYRRAFEYYNYPEASAISVLICIMLVALSALYTKLTKSKDD
ncbi:MAG: sugar ABC transporter permease [Lachnospiraceae bacterium]|nr:sugar ABC transporter permease [Lachnospiraceae bacterium]